MFQKYSLRYEGDLVKGARKLLEVYPNNFKQTALDYDKKILNIGEINNVAVIVSESCSIPNFSMVGLKELIQKTEKEIISNKLKLKKQK